MTSTREDLLAGALLGCALGDALGLPAEGMSSTSIARRFAKEPDRFHLIGRTGFVSDDTEQTALVAEAFARHSDAGADDDVVRHFRRRLVGWFLRLPFGIGFATLRACTKIMLGVQRSGVRSAGNGAAMRAAIVGVILVDDPLRRRAIGRRLAMVTHTDDRAVDGALFVAELAAHLAKQPHADRAAAANAALDVVVEPSLRAALLEAIRLAKSDATDVDAARAIGVSGFVMHTVPLVAFMVVRHGDDVLRAIQATIAVGGDTDSNAAIVGAIGGGQHGASSLPSTLIGHLQDGPFGPRHLRALSTSLADHTPPPSWSGTIAFLRNLALYPVVIAHVFRRLLPW